MKNEQDLLLADALSAPGRQCQESIEDLMGLGKEGLGKMVFSDEEVRIKERIWVGLNKESCQ